jgi:NADH-quinone oxidoreductase subunit L
VSAVAIGAMLLSFALVLVNFAKLSASLEPEHRYLYNHAWQMVRIGSLDVNFAFAMDPLSAVMCLIITGVGTLIHIYAASYMETEPAFWRFFTYLNLFVFSMLLLVLGDNFVVMFFGWEGVGLCSYLLIGFWYKDYKKATAGMKAFVVNRVGDWGFICGLGLLFWGMGGKWLPNGQYLPDYNASASSREGRGRSRTVKRAASTARRPRARRPSKPAARAARAATETAPRRRQGPKLAGPRRS